MDEYPKWIYFTDGPQEFYADGMEPVLVQSREEEEALSEDAPVDAIGVAPIRRGRPPKVQAK